MIPSRRYEALVAEYGGSRVIRRVLIANNGMAATKFIISIRRWLHLSCGDAGLIQLIGMATPDDIRANARHVSLADVIEEVPGGSNRQNYADVNLIIQLAIKHKCDAIWPGWGHASENPALPLAAAEAGILFVGPDEHAMFALGDKVASTLIAQTAKVPCVSWSGSGLTLHAGNGHAHGADGGEAEPGSRLTVPAEMFARACVHSAEEALAVAERVGYPIMIKASEGGGGKGVRKALHKGAVADMFRQVADEVKGSPIFLMRLCERARHIEIQLVCDSHGAVAVLSGRDCSMQRRFQKIVEEGPPRCVPPATMAAMERAGMRLASLVGYVNAGTVEFLYVEGSDEFFFLELNPRLQVEHPVTEGVTGLNVPCLQLLVAMGCQLSRVPRVRDFIVAEGEEEAAAEARACGGGGAYDPFEKIGSRHTVAARITAENTMDGWKPTVGAISAISFQSLPDVWGYFSVEGGASAVHQFADSQFGHIFASGPSRAEAIDGLLLALDTLSVRGEVRTNIKMVRSLVDSADFRANRVDTSWLDRIIAQGGAPGRDDGGGAAPHSPLAAGGGPGGAGGALSEQTIAICGALIHAWRGIEATTNRICDDFIARAAMPPEALVQSLAECKVEFVCSKVSYALEVYRHAPTVFSVAANGSLVQAKLYPMPAPGTFLVAYGDRKLQVSAQDEPGGSVRLSINGHVCVVEQEKDPSVLTTAYTGKLTRFLVEEGAHVAKGAAFAEIEVMKMLCMLTAPEAGVLSIERPAGSFVSSGDVVARMELDDPSLVERPTPFAHELGDVAPIIDDGALAAAGGTRSLSSVLGALSARLESIFAGYLDNEEEVLSQVHEALHDPALLHRELAENLRAMRNLPRGLGEQLAALAAGAMPPSPSAAGGAPPLLSPTAAGGGGLLGGNGNSGGSGGGGPLELGGRVLALLHSHRAAAEEEVRAAGGSASDVLEAAAAFDAATAPALDFALAHARGTRARAHGLVATFAHRFLDVETLYAKSHTMAALLLACDSDPKKLVSVFLAHSQLERRSNTLIALIDIVNGAAAAAGGLADDEATADAVSDGRAAYLRPLAALEGINYARLQLRAKQLLGSMGDDMASHLTKQLFPSLHRMAAGTLSADEETALTRYLQAHMHVAQALLFRAYAEATSGLRKAVARTLVLLWYGHARPSNLSVKTFFRTGKEKFVLTWEHDSPQQQHAQQQQQQHGGEGNGGGLSRPRAALMVGGPDAPPTPPTPSSSFGGSAAGSERGLPPGREAGALVFFSSKEDMEAHFAWLCGCISGVSGPAGGADGGGKLGGVSRARSSTGGGGACGMTRNLSSSKGLATLAGCGSALAAAAAAGGAAAGSNGASGWSGAGRTLHVVVMAEVGAEHKWKPPHRRIGGHGGGASASYDSFDDAGTAKYYSEFVRANGAALRALEATHVAVTVPTPSRESQHVEAAMAMVVTPTYNFGLPEFAEVRAHRHMLPQFVPWLELERLAAFELKHEALPVHPLVHVLVGTARGQAQDRRLFVRAASLVAADAHSLPRPQGRFGRPRSDSSGIVSLEPLSPSLGASEPAASPEAAHAHAAPGDERHVALALKGVLEACTPALSAAKTAHLTSVHVFLHHLQPLLVVPDRLLAATAAALRAELAQPALSLALSLLDLEVRLGRAETLAPLGRGRPDDEQQQPQPGGGGGACGMRLVLRMSHVLQTALYQEVPAPAGACASDGGGAPARLRLVASRPSADVCSSLDGSIAGQPYALLSVVDQRRQRCHKAGTTYCYDWVGLFNAALKAEWDAAIGAGAVDASELPAALVSAVELELAAGSAELRPLAQPREPGLNKVGMVAWLLTLRTPEYPAGRQAVLIANDLSIENGTFGPKEDEVFKRASQLARQRRIPRLYLGANSGARFGLSESVKGRFRVEWVDWDDPNKGIAYLYLTPKDREALGDSVVTEEVVVPISSARRQLQLGGLGGGSGFESDGEGAHGAAGSADEPVSHEVQHKLLAIIGQEEGLGVECLQGSGMIAAETAIANREVFTIALSTSRNIGIGSYVLRLGQRIVQHRAAPIILTGHVALNKLLGNNVYESNLQLGGPEVMASNGISHAVVDSDLAGIAAIVRWLGYVPATADSPPAVLRTRDPIERDVEFCPAPGELYDPRCLIAGDGSRPGLFDSGSFTETLADWARTVVVGRARLGGIPIGVIATENRLVMKTVLADPANMQSREEQVAQAGQVWFPDSAYKTAQAIRDFNAGERLPLLILANWRGFSGGRKDMFEEVLKFGSYIVEHLTQFEQPVFVYVPPHAEVRGGAWVVIDPQINPRVMEMYADCTARGGVLEPAGIAEIKFRRAELLKAMHRLDPQLQWMRMNAAPGVVTKEDISAHEAELIPAYAPLGEAFADLHDRPERMLAKGVIRKVVPWRDARRHFYWRLKRRLAEMPLQRRIESRAPALAPRDVASVLSRALLENAGLSAGHADDDRAVCGCLDALDADGLDELRAAIDEFADAALTDGSHAD